MTDIDDFDEQLNNDLDVFERDINTLVSKNFEQKQILIKKLTQKQKQIATTIESYDLEINSIDRASAAKYQKSYTSINQKFNKLKNELQYKKNDGNNQQGLFQEKQEKDLSQMNQDELIQLGKNTQQDGINRLDGIIGTVNQGNLLADEINLELDKQIQQLDRMHATVKDTQTSLQRSKALIKYFGRVVQTDKCIMGMIFLVVLAIVVIIILSLCGYSVTGSSSPVQDVIK